MYDALSAPVEAPKAMGPSAIAQLKLSPSYISDLSLSFESLVHQQDQIKDQKMTSAHNLLSPTPTLSQISHVVHLNALASRPAKAQKAFDLISDTGLAPDVISFNHLMDAYARVHDVDQVEKIFMEIQARHLSPDIVTFSTFIKTLVQSGQLKRAYKVYETMKESGITPNRIVFTTLIKGCLRENDLERAWKTFDHMRSEVCEPDTMTYSLMIHACSKTQDAERALDLFEEMGKKGLSVTNVTFTSLIQACSSRKDYYLESFNLLEQMVHQGFQPSIYTYNTLLSAAAKQVDVDRARFVWNDLIVRSKSQPDLVPDSFSFSMMFKVFANSISALRRQKSKEPAVPEESASTALVASDHPLVLISNDTHTSTLFQDAHKLWLLVSDPASSEILPSPIEINTHLLDTYFKVLTSHPGRPGALEQSLEFFNTEYQKHGLSPTGPAHLSLLSLITRNKKSFELHGPAFWDRFLEWDKTMESQFDHLPAPISEEEKERMRVQEHRGRDHMFKAFMDMARGYTRLGQTNHAIAVMEASQKFRAQDYLRPILFRDVWSLVEKARDEAEDGNWDLGKKLMEICARPDTDPISVVQKSLKLKNLPKHWWGWRSLGLSEDEIRKLQKRNRKEKEKAQMRKQAHKNKPTAKKTA